MLDLPDVMLCAVDTVTVPLAISALRRSMEKIRFGDVVLITHEPQQGQLPFRTEIIPPLRSRSDYSEFVIAHLGEHTTRAFNLLVQWDGYVLEPAAWRAKFLQFDYIGARWPWHRDGLDVGNGGFSLRSKKLLTKLAAYSLPSNSAGINEDELICRMLRPRLQQEGFSFAPPVMADAFSYERVLPNKPTFGFHGLFNMWRHVSDEDMEQVAATCPDHVVKSREWAELTVIYYNLRKFRLLTALLRRLRRLFNEQQVRKRFGEFFPGDARIAETVRILEGLL